MADGSLIEVEVVYAQPRAQTVIAITVPAGSTVEQAIAQSGMAMKHPGIDWDRVETAIFGKRASAATVLQAYDRVEICRPLIANPKQARRRRARKSSVSRR